ncbi:MAG: hypothetical protein G01um101413_736 [Parcubacteria group bacterium Gr01-1014_13]|nr:MAG: hypothetical protein G01um101413_736 [Parcubacteria group bacterium Gr01-1014_13]
MKDIMFGLLGMALCFFAYFLLGSDIAFLFSTFVCESNDLSSGGFVVLSKILLGLWFLSVAFGVFVILWFPLISALDLVQDARHHRRLIKNLAPNRAR